VISATARRAEHSLAASSQIRMQVCLKGLLTHANGIRYTPLNSQKGGQLSVSQAWRIVNALAGGSNVTKKVSPHTWRHSIATQLLDAGAPLHKVSSFLGHSDPMITVKAHYSDSEGLKVEDFIEVE